MYHPEGPSFLELMEQALSSTDEGYDLLAPKFDYTPFRTPDAVLSRVAEELRGLGPFEATVDLCCGTGAGLRAMRPLSGALWGIDRSEGMLAEARRRLEEEPGLPPGAPAPPVHLVKGDAMASPFEDGQFDLAVSFGAFGHILEEDEARFVREIRRILRPGGRFAFVTSDLPPITHPWRWIARGFNAAMRARNALIDPPFIMYYLTFLIPGVCGLLEDEGFTVETRAGLFGRPYERASLVIATRRP